MKPSRHFVVIAVALVAVLAMAGPLVVTFADDSKPDMKVPVLDAASASVKAFLSTYADAEGRIGPDGTNEGKPSNQETYQGFGLLLAAATGDKPRFARIWSWTKLHALPTDGLQSSDRMVIARALAVASKKFEDPTFIDDAKLVSGHPLDDVTAAALPAGEYDPRALAEMIALTADKRWQTQLESQQNQLFAQLGPDGVRLPGDATKRDEYSADAARTPIRLAESCDSQDRELAKSIWRVLSRSRDTRTAAVLSTEGKVIDKTIGTVNVVGAAAAAAAAGETQQMTDLLNSAEANNAQHSSLEGAAWVAIGRVSLTTNWLGTC